MARKVTCKICRNIGDTGTFYKVTNEKGINAYFCSKEEYDEREKEKNDRYDLLKYVAEEVLQYKDGQIVPPSMVKRIEKLNKFYKYEVIKESFYINVDTIHYWIKVKDFSNEYGMSSYVMTIIESSINDIYKKWQRQQEQLSKMDKMTIDTSLFNEITIEDVVVKSKGNNGISMFLDEEDL